MAAAARNSLIFVLLAGAAGATWLLNRPQQPELDAASSPNAAESGYYLRDAVILGTDADGTIAYRIFAGRVEQRQHDQSLALTDVRLEYDAGQRVPWLITASSGTVPGGEESLQLHDVRLSRGAHRDEGPIVIETEVLEIDPDTYVARAAAPVTLSSGAATLEARGFRADLKQDRVELEGGHGNFSR